MTALQTRYTALRGFLNTIIYVRPWRELVTEPGREGASARALCLTLLCSGEVGNLERVQNRATSDTGAGKQDWE